MFIRWKKTMLEMVSMNSPLQNLFRHWRASLETRCTSSICASPSFNSTLSSVWSPTSPNTSSNTMASRHPRPISSWVRRLFLYNLWCLSCLNGLCLVMLSSRELVQNLYFITEWHVIRDVKCCELDGHHKCFMSQLLMKFLCCISRIPSQQTLQLQKDN